MQLLSSQPNRLGLAIACAGGALLAVLAAGGPFFDVMRPATPHPVQMTFIPGDGMVVTSVGKYDPAARVFTTNHAQGALVFGPYMTLQPGKYVVSWTGMSRHAGAPQFEVFSTHSGMIAMGNAPVPVSAGSTVLQRLEFDVPETCPGVELRVIVGEGDDLTIDGITLEASGVRKGAKHD